MATLSSLSHLTLAAPTLHLFQEAQAFYTLLGFKLISHSGFTSFPNAPPSADIPEAWLHLYPPGAQDHALEAASGNFGVSLRIVLEVKEGIDEDVWREQVQAKFERLRAEQHVKDAAWGCYIVEDLKVCG